MKQFDLTLTSIRPIDIDATTSNDGFIVPLTRIKLYKIDLEDIMENLNFEDVMNYYDIQKVLDWTKGK